MWRARGDNSLKIKLVILALAVVPAVEVLGKLEHNFVDVDAFADNYRCRGDAALAFLLGDEFAIFIDH